MTNQTPFQAQDPGGNSTPSPRKQDPSHQYAHGNPDVTFRDTSNRATTAGFVNDFPTVPAPRSPQELILCGVEAGALSLRAASLAVDGGLLTEEQQLVAEAQFLERYGFEHFAAQARRVRA